MSTGKVILITLITSLITSAASFYTLRAITSKGLFSGDQMTVPSIVGFRPDQARQMLEPMGLLLVVSEEREDTSVEIGRIATQSPMEGSQVKKGVTIQVVVSKGKGTVKVPIIVGLPLAGARQILASAGLKPGTASPKISDQVPAGQVIASSPAEGAEVAQGALISLVVSSGQDTIEVPKLKGIGIGRAKKMLTDAGFKVGRVTREYDEDLGGDVVLNQEPAAGTRQARGTEVNLVINEGDDSD